MAAATAITLLISLSGMTCITGLTLKLTSIEEPPRETPVVRISIPRPPVWIDERKTR